VTAAKPPALCAYCPACGGPAVPLNRTGGYRPHNRCANARKTATDANVARWVRWETNTAGAGARHCAERLTRAREEIARAERDDTEARARLAAIEAIAAARGITTKDTDR